MKTVKIEDIRDLTKEEVREKIKHYLKTGEVDEELELFVKKKMKECKNMGECIKFVEEWLY